MWTQAAAFDVGGDISREGNPQSAVARKVYERAREM
jgi:hypothetical protein